MAAYQRAKANNKVTANVASYTPYNNPMADAYETALANALNNKTIAGAGLDVFSREPLHSSPLYDLADNYSLVASPHTAWAADEARKVLIEKIAENIKEYITNS